MSTIRKINISVLFAGKLAFPIAFGVSLMGQPAAAANDFTAEKVLKEMSSQQQSAYLAGVVEGLAVARYMKDGKQNTGMQCIYDWFYEDKQTLQKINDAFEKYPTYPPGSIIDLLSKQKCGE